MRADELSPGDRIRHPTTEQIVTVDHIATGLSWVKVHFKAHGARGFFKTNPQTELEDCT